MKLNSKIIIVFLTVLLPSILVIGVFTYSLIIGNVNNKAKEELENFSARQENKINLQIIKQWEKANEVANRRDLKKVLENLLARVSTSSEQVVLVLDDAVEEYPEIIDLSIILKNGKIIAYSSDLDKDLVDIFGNNQPRKGVFIHNDVNNNLPYLIYSSPIYLNNRVSAYLLAKVNSSAIYSIVKNYTELGETGETVIAKYTSDNIVKFLFPLRFEDEYDNEINKIYSSDLNVPIVQALDKNENYFDNFTDYRGKKVLSSTKYLDMIGWGLVVKKDKAEVYKSIYKLRINFFVIILFSLIVNVLVAHFLARLFTNPIKSLARATKKIAEGDLDQRVNYESEDELGELSDNFNRMSKQLSDFYNKLEEKVRERTKELNKRTMELDKQKEELGVKIKEIEKFNRHLVGREVKMVELKKEINSLKKKKFKKRFKK